MVQLASDIKEHVDALMDKSNGEFDEKNYVDSINTLIKAWEKLPEPTGIYDDSYHLAFYICDTYLLIKDYKNAEIWSNTIFECDLDRIDSGEREFLAGKVSFESGNLDEANDFFKIANKKSEGRCFEDEDEKYFKLFSEGN